MTTLSGVVSAQDRTHFDVDMILAALEFAGRSDSVQLEQIRDIIASRSSKEIHLLRILAEDIIDELTEDPDPDDELCIGEAFSCMNVSAEHLCEGVEVRPLMRITGLA